ncbi:MAG: cell division protein FtsZ [Thermodesulfobacteriota bacterium]
MLFNFVDTGKQAKIKVIGAGGAGCNAINNMILANLDGVRFIVANTDCQALEASRAEVKIQLGARLTGGLGAGANPDVGRDAAKESRDAIRDALAGSHMVFIAAGMGGGTGTGAAPIIAEVCKDLGILTVAVVTKPFQFEGTKRRKLADQGIAALKEVADTVITIPNDRLRKAAEHNEDPETGEKKEKAARPRFVDMVKMADDVLLNAVRGITDLILKPGYVNLDFADVKTIMSKSGLALMGIGKATGENRAILAAKRAICHPLLEDLSIVGARGVLMNITCSSDVPMDEVDEASSYIYGEAGDDAEIIWGMVIDDNAGDEMRITLIATGIESEKEIITARPVFGASRSGNVLQAVPPGGETPDIPGLDSLDLDNPDTPTFMRRGADRKKKVAQASGSLGDWDMPSYIRRKQAVGEEDGKASYRGVDTAAGGDYDKPAFMRRPAADQK